MRARAGTGVMSDFARYTKRTKSQNRRKNVEAAKITEREALEHAAADG
jgi:hypothetical protein